MSWELIKYIKEELAHAQKEIRVELSEVRNELQEVQKVIDQIHLKLGNKKESLKFWTQFIASLAAITVAVLAFFKGAL